MYKMGVTVHAIVNECHHSPSITTISPLFLDNHHVLGTHMESAVGSDRLYAAGGVSEFMMRFALDRCLDARSALKLS